MNNLNVIALNLWRFQVNFFKDEKICDLIEFYCPQLTTEEKLEVIAKIEDLVVRRNAWQLP